MSTGPPAATVIGGGPAGLMASEVLVRAGFEVAVHDVRRSMGRKLLLAGRSGLNLTHSEPVDDLISRYEPCAPALEHAIRRFDASWLRAWAAGLGEQTFVGSSGRVFPQSFRAAPLLRAWLGRLAAAGVEFRGEHRWTGWDDRGRVRFVVDGTEVGIASDVTVLALGGASWPRVGSDGSWTALLEARGVEIAPLRAANCGVVVAWTPVFIDRFEGEPVKNVVVRVGEITARGEMIITREGLEGGPIYTTAAEVHRQIDSGRPHAGELRIDLMPDLSAARIVARLASRRPKETQSSWLRRAGFAPVEVALLREATGNRLPDDAAGLADLAKSAPIRTRGLMPLARAISTAGGVAFATLDERFMIRSLPGTFVAGEMLDWDAPTGGYLLQACFASGAAAAEGARMWMES